MRIYCCLTTGREGDGFFFSKTPYPGAKWADDRFFFVCEKRLSPGPQHRGSRCRRIAVANMGVFDERSTPAILSRASAVLPCEPLLVAGCPRVPALGHTNIYTSRPPALSPTRAGSVGAVESARSAYNQEVVRLEVRAASSSSLLPCPPFLAPFLHVKSRQSGAEAAGA